MTSLAGASSSGRARSSSRGRNWSKAAKPAPVPRAFFHWLEAPGIPSGHGMWFKIPARMAKSYSQDLRNPVLDAVEVEGISCRAAAARYEVSEAAAIKWVARYRWTGQRTPVEKGHRRAVLKPHREFLEAARVGQPYITLEALACHGARYQGGHLDAKPLFPAQGDHVQKNDARRQRAGPRRGERLRDKVPHGHWKTSTFLAALRHDGIAAPCLFDGPINGERFLAYVEQILVPALKPGDVVVLDNLGSHKGKAARQAIRTAGAKLIFLPKYSPTSTRSSGFSQNSKPCCAKPPPELSCYHPRHRPAPRQLRARRVRQLFHQRRLCLDLKANCSRGPTPARLFRALTATAADVALWEGRVRPAGTPRALRSRWQPARSAGTCPASRSWRQP